MLRSIKYGLYGALLAGLVAVPIAWNSVDKTVNLVVDGRSSTVQTTAQSVGEVVRDRGYRVTAHDLLAPSAGAPVKDGGRIVLRRGRLLELDIDGRHTAVWTTATTVSAALAELGYPSADFVSVSRSRRLPLGVTNLAIRTPRLVTVVHDGHSQQVSTTDATVAELFADLGIRVGPTDRLSAAPASALTPGETIRLQRVGTKLLTRVEAVPYPTKRERDSALSFGVTKVVSAGAAGKVKVTYSLVYVDGRVVGRTKVGAVTLAQPRPKIIKVGTKQVEVAADSGGGGAEAPQPAGASNGAGASPSEAKAIARQLLSQRGWGSDQYDCLVTLWDHESGWRVHATNPSSGAYGIPQALPGSKMSSAGPDWQDNATTQIKWGLGYISDRYNNPCEAWSTWQAQGGWY